MSKRLVIGGVAGAGAGALAVFVALGAAGVGHGTYIPAAVLFPLSMLIAISAGSINFLSATLAVAQFPLYGVAVVGPRSVRRWLAVACLHLLLAVVAFLSVQRSESFGATGRFL